MTSKGRRPQKEEDLKNEDDPKNGNNRKNEYNFEFEDNLQIKTISMIYQTMVPGASFNHVIHFLVPYLFRFVFISWVVVSFVVIPIF